MDKKFYLVVHLIVLMCALQEIKATGYKVKTLHTHTVNGILSISYDNYHFYRLYIYHPH